MVENEILDMYKLGVRITVICSSVMRCRFKISMEKGELYERAKTIFV